MREASLKAKIKKYGGQDKLANDLGVSQQAVSLWCKNGVPAKRIKKVSEILGISKKELNPDLFS